MRLPARSRAGMSSSSGGSAADEPLHRVVKNFARGCNTENELPGKNALGLPPLAYASWALPGWVGGLDG